MSLMLNFHMYFKVPKEKKLLLKKKNKNAHLEKIFTHVAFLFHGVGPLSE